MKPLLRWSMGPALFDGFSVLGYSVNKAIELYPEFDFVICHNQLNCDQKKFIDSLDVENIDTTHMTDSLNIRTDEGYFVSWKLFPPRINIETHEIWIDNDIVLNKRIPEIEAFLNVPNSVLLHQGINKNLHGAFNEKIPEGVRINTGIFGIPPKMDFQCKLNQNIKESRISKWESRFDEQGLVAKTLLDEEIVYIIPQTSITLIQNTWRLKPFLNQPLINGFHFAGVNYYGTHLGWNDYLQMNMKCL